MQNKMYRQSFGPGAEIFQQGDTGDCAYIIESGHVEIFSQRGGSELTLACLGAGEIFGEMALIDEQLRSATARTVDAATLVVIRRDQVRQKIQRADPVLNLFLKVILERLRATNAMIDLLRHAPELAEEPVESNHHPFADVRELAITQLKLEQELKEAVEGGQLKVYFQPIICTRGGHTAGFEALVRWQHPERGLVPPMDFIGMAEETGLIVPLGIQVLEASCAGLAILQERLDQSFDDHPRAFMGVNLSARQIVEPGLAAKVEEVISGFSIRACEIKLEVTESVLMEDPEKTVQVLGQLKELGVELAVDDFGTGYSSLSYLHRFPIDVVKVDRSFVNTMLSDSGNLKIVRGIISLARELGMKLVAEGVERNQELALIRDLGCEFAQGYLFSRPLPLEEAVELVGKRLG